MAFLYEPMNPPLTQYIDSKAIREGYVESREEMERLLRTTSTLYIGNLSFYTTEEQIYELFSKVGEIKRIIMGLDRNRKTPCGFCFVEYYRRPDAEDCIRYISQTKLDDRLIRCDWDYGFREGRQYGRGRSGGQVRDEYRTDFDAGRGGYGKLRQREIEELEQKRAAGYKEIYDGTQVPRGTEDQQVYSSASGRDAPGSAAASVYGRGRSESGYLGKRGRDSGASEGDGDKRARTSEAKNPRFREEKDEEED
eukprot:tig00021682_g23098.t1